MSTEPGLDIGIKVTADTSGAKELEQSLKKVAAGAKEIGIANRAVNGGEVIRKYGNAAVVASDDVKTLANSAKGAAEVMHGLERASQGGIGGLVGLGQAARGAAHLMHGAFTALGAPLAVITAALGGIKFIFDDMVSTAQNGLTRAFADVGKQTEELKKKQVELEAQSKVSLEAQLAEVEKLSAAYSDLISRMDEAESRHKSIKAAQRDLELSQATNDDERQAIRDRFAQNEILSGGDNAKIKIDNANDTLAKLSSERRGIETQVFQKQRAFDAADDPQKKKLAKLELESAQKELAAIQEKQSPIIDRANKQIDDARLTQEINPLKAKTLKNNSAAEQRDRLVDSIRTADDGPDLIDTGSIRGRIEAAEGRRQELGDAAFRDHSFKLGGTPASNAAAEQDKLIDTLREQLSATEAKNGEITALFKKGLKNEKKTAEQLKNIRPGS